MPVARVESICGATRYGPGELDFRVRCANGSKNPFNGEPICLGPQGCQDKVRQIRGFIDENFSGEYEALTQGFRRPEEGDCGAEALIGFATAYLQAKERHQDA